jgi:hypothetical protein
VGDASQLRGVRRVFALWRAARLFLHVEVERQLQWWPACPDSTARGSGGWCWVGEEVWRGVDGRGGVDELTLCSPVMQTVGRSLVVAAVLRRIDPGRGGIAAAASCLAACTCYLWLWMLGVGGVGA